MRERADVYVWKSRGLVCVRVCVHSYLVCLVNLNTLVIEQEPYDIDVTVLGSRKKGRGARLWEQTRMTPL